MIKSILLINCRDSFPKKKWTFYHYCFYGGSVLRTFLIYFVSYISGVVSPTGSPVRLGTVHSTNRTDEGIISVRGSKDSSEITGGNRENGKRGPKDGRSKRIISDPQVEVNRRLL